MGGLVSSMRGKKSKKEFQDHLRRAPSGSEQKARRYACSSPQNRYDHLDIVAQTRLGSFCEMALQWIGSSARVADHLQCGPAHFLDLPHPRRMQSSNRATRACCTLVVADRPTSFLLLSPCLPRHRCPSAPWEAPLPWQLPLSAPGCRFSVTGGDMHIYPEQGEVRHLSDP
jgi:hypothetical protein